MNVAVQVNATSRRYTAVQMVVALREELGAEQGTVAGVPQQLGYGVESVRSWLKHADTYRGHRPGLVSVDADENKRRPQENRELKRANKILKRAATFFWAELDRQQKWWSGSSIKTVVSSESSRSVKCCGVLRPPITARNPALSSGRPATWSESRSWSHCGRPTPRRMAPTNCGSLSARLAMRPGVIRSPR